jgi:hypothetical protein
VRLQQAFEKPPSVVAADVRRLKFLRKIETVQSLPTNGWLE